MNKYYKTIGVVALLIIGLVIALISGGQSRYEGISYEDYMALDGSKVVYIGDNDEIMDNLSNITLKKGYNLAYVDYSKLKKNEKKELEKETIEVWTDGKLVSTYTFNMFDKKGNKKSELKEVNLKEYLSQMKKDGLNFMFIGSDTCGHCINFKDTITSFFEDHNANISYINIGNLEEKDYNKLIETDEYFSTQEWGTPTSLIYYNGQKIDLISGEINKEELTNTFNNNLGIKVFLIDNKVM